MSVPQKWQQGRLGQLLVVHGPPENSKDTTDTALIQRYPNGKNQVVFVSRRDRLLAPVYPIIEIEEDDEWTAAFKDWIGSMKKKVKTLILHPSIKKIDKRRSSKPSGDFKDFSFNLTVHLLHQIREDKWFSKCNPKLQKRLVPRYGRPRHPLAEELGVDFEGEIGICDSKPYGLTQTGLRIENHIIGKGMQLCYRKSDSRPRTGCQQCGEVVTWVSDFDRGPELPWLSCNPASRVDENSNIEGKKGTERNSSTEVSGTVIIQSMDLRDSTEDRGTMEEGARKTKVDEKQSHRHKLISSCKKKLKIIYESRLEVKKQADHKIRETAGREGPVPVDKKIKRAAVLRGFCKRKKEQKSAASQHIS